MKNNTFEPIGYIVYTIEFGVSYNTGGHELLTKDEAIQKALSILDERAEDNPWLNQLHPHFKDRWYDTELKEYKRRKQAIERLKVVDLSDDEDLIIVPIISKIKNDKATKTLGRQAPRLVK